MKSMKLAALFGAFLFTAGVGCGTVDSTAGVTASDLTNVAGNDVVGEQLATADGSGAGAMDHAGPCGRLELGRLQALLGLSADQVTQIQQIIDATRQALSDIRAQVKAGTLSKTDAEAQVKAAHDKQEQQILVVLTPDQQAKFKTMHDHHGQPLDLDRLAQFLGLSADQVTQISNILSAAKAQIDALNMQVEAGTLAEADARTQIQQIVQMQLASIKAVLTPDQLAKLPPGVLDGGHGDGDHGPGPMPPPPAGH